MLKRLRKWEMDRFYQYVYEVIKRTQGRSATSFRAKFPWSPELEEQAKSLSVEELLDNPYYMGKKESLFPEHRSDILELFERKANGENIELFVDEEGWGSGKTYKFAALLYIMVFEHIIMTDFRRDYPTLDPGTGISFVCTSRTGQLAKEITFEKVLPFFLESPFFLDYFPPDVDMKQIEDFKRKPDRLRFPNKILIFTGTGSALSAIGYDLAGGGIDEVNFFDYVEGSVRNDFSIDNEDGVYDAAEFIVRTVRGRIRSRFMINGKLSKYSLLMAMSSSGFSGDFTSRMREQAKVDPTIFYRNRATWEGRPRVWHGKQIYSDKTFDFDLRTMQVVDLEKKKEEYLMEFGRSVEI